jgi:hypothetical protein
MSFHRPFDDVQWDAASLTHRQMRRNLQNLREQFPPRSRQQRELLRKYRNVARLFREELLKPRGKIDPDVLNDLSATAAEHYVEYAMRRGVR